jgi:hypothetical protein
MVGLTAKKKAEESFPAVPTDRPTDAQSFGTFAKCGAVS